eukprot:CAMPEP_0119324314 /NCGR_PEP_ID=MMETSP1333-20130426/62826_1 /TAXON_ID=418940 /ORGANISM="Scyphosphaera apsteinii, Strain RCC1455" /LENGTH=287 /DNA_ID=CAMNT_0007331993 /DNA_START=68 /DNA_END=931 /DNA_ORIENTATION=+
MNLVFRAIDVEDAGAVGIDEVLQFGRTVNAYWADWPPAACAELAGCAEGTNSFTETEFAVFLEGLRPWTPDADLVATFVDAGMSRRVLVDPYNSRRIEQAFRAMDLDDSGQIDIAELLHFGAKIGAGWSKAACDTLLGRMDTDGDAKISLTEFAEFINKVGLHGCHEEVAAFVEAGAANRALVEPISEETIRKAFRAIDLDDSGQIDLAELLHFGATTSEGWSRATCEAILGRIDTDGDSNVSLEEFTAFVSDVGLHGCHKEVAAFIEAGEARRSLTKADSDADDDD